MIKKIKKWLWPHKKNKYRPYALRPLGLAIFLVVVALMPLAYNLSSAHKPQVLGYATDISAYNIYSLTNVERQSAGVPALSLNSRLSTAAENKAKDMFANDYWAHVSPTGVEPWSFITNAGYSYTAAAENLAKDFLTSSGVITGWMDSSEHRDNMLNPAYKDVGFAVMNGSLLGSQTTLVVAMYAAPATAAKQPVKAAPGITGTNQSPTSPATTTHQPASPTKPTSQPTRKPAVESSNTAAKQLAAGSQASGQVLGDRLSLATMVGNISALNWGQRATIFLASSLMLASLLAHTVVWRLKKRGRHQIWLRAHPLMQASLLLVVALVTITSGFGVTK